MPLTAKYTMTQEEEQRWQAKLTPLEYLMHGLRNYRGTSLRDRALGAKHDYLFCSYCQGESFDTILEERKQKESWNDPR